MQNLADLFLGGGLDKSKGGAQRKEGKWPFRGFCPPNNSSAPPFFNCCPALQSVSPGGNVNLEETEASLSGRTYPDRPYCVSACVWVRERERCTLNPGFLESPTTVSESPTRRL